MRDTPDSRPGALIKEVVDDLRQTPLRWWPLRFGVAAVFATYWLVAAVWTTVVKLWFRARERRR
jgi:hypothetical protein